VARRLAGLGGRTLGDHGAAGDQRGPVGGARGAKRGVDRLGIVPVDRRGVPAIGREPCELVVRDRERGRPVDRDAVVVEQDDQPVELEVPGERGRLVADALHQAAVAGDHVGAVVDQPAAESGREVALGQRHADRVGDALAERAGRGLDAEGVAELGMPGSAGPELAEALQLLERHVGVAGEVEQRVEQHRAVAGREHEPVAVGPVGMLGGEFQVAGEQHGGDVGHAHGQARMAGPGLLDGVHGERPDGVGKVVVTDRTGGHGRATCLKRV
jgi:hypothetical protein